MRWFVFSILTLAATVSPVHAREWTDITGQFHIEGELISAKAEKIRVRTTDGKIHGCKLEQLSAGDRAFLEQLKTAGYEPSSVAVSTVAAPVPTKLTSEVVQAAPVVPQAADAANWPLKYVYQGHKGTFHLFIDKTPPNIAHGSGTANYHFLAWYLAKLTQVSTDPGYYYFKPEGGDPFIKQWAFSRHPDPCTHCYTVWYGLGTPNAGTFDWHRFEDAHRYRPW